MRAISRVRHVRRVLRGVVGSVVGVGRDRLVVVNQKRKEAKKQGTVPVRPCTRLVVWWFESLLLGSSELTKYPENTHTSSPTDDFLPGTGKGLLTFDPPQTRETICLFAGLKNSME